MTRYVHWQVPASRQGGLSLVELMVGITVGLFVVAAAATLVAGQLSDNRRLTLEVQVQQDLRASMDIITRQIRRAGSTTQGAAQNAVPTVVGLGGGNVATLPLTPAAGVSSIVEFTYDDVANISRTYGFKLEGEAIKTAIPDAGWQELTDRNALRVTAFTVTPANITSAVLPCPVLCPGVGGGTACWPTVTVRDLVVSITAEARSDRAVQRTITNRVRIRNDVVNFNNGGADICPLPP